MLYNVLLLYMVHFMIVIKDVSYFNYPRILNCQHRNWWFLHLICMLHIWYNMSYHHKTQETNRWTSLPLFFSHSGILFMYSTRSVWVGLGVCICMCAVGCVGVCFDILLPFLSYCLVKSVGTNVQGRQRVMLREHAKDWEQSTAHICCEYKRRTSA